METRQEFGADYALFVGPLPAERSETGLVSLALATPSETIPMSLPFLGHPDILKARLGKSGLNMVRLKLMKL